MRFIDEREKSIYPNGREKKSIYSNGRESTHFIHTFYSFNLLTTINRLTAPAQGRQPNFSPAAEYIFPGNLARAMMYLQTRPGSARYTTETFSILLVHPHVHCEAPTRVGF